MNREFRVWGIDDKRYISNDEQLLIMDDGILVYLDENTGCLEPYPSETIVEFSTGLKDLIAQRKIYAGDLINCGCGDFPIEWDDTCTGYIVNVDNDQYGLHQYLFEFKGKITGTIHNKEQG